MEDFTTIKMTEEERKTHDDLIKMIEDSKENLEPYLSEVETARKTYRAEYSTPKGRSAAKVMHAKQMADHMVAQLCNDFLSEDEPAYFMPRHKDADQKARLMGKYINYHWSRKFPSVEFIEEFCRASVIDGTVVVKTGWRYDYDIVDEQKQDIPIEDYADFVTRQQADGYIIADMGTEEDGLMKGVVTQKHEVYEDGPDATIIPLESCYFDVTMRRSDDIRWFAEKMRMTISDIRKQDVEYNKKSQLQLENVDRWIGKLYFASLDNDRDITNVSEYSTEDLYYQIDDYARKNARKYVDVYRFIGEYDLNKDGIAEYVEAIFTKDYLITIRPYKKIKGLKLPYFISTYIKHNDEKCGEGMMTSVADTQKNYVTLWRMLMDYVARVNLSDKIVNTLMITDPIEFRKMEENLPGTIYKAHGDVGSAMSNIPQPPFPAGVDRMLQMTSIEEQRASKVGENTAGVYNAPSSAKTATAAAIAAQGLQSFYNFVFTKLRNNGLKKLFEHWQALTNHYVDPETDIFFQDVIGEGMIDVKAEDFLGLYDVDVTFNTQNMADLKIHQINILLQNSQLAIQTGAVAPKELAYLYRKLYTLMGDKMLAQQVSRRLELQEDDEVRKAAEELASNMVEELRQSPEFEKMVKDQAREIAKTEGYYEAVRLFNMWTGKLSADQQGGENGTIQ